MRRHRQRVGGEEAGLLAQAGDHDVVDRHDDDRQPDETTDGCRDIAPFRSITVPPAGSASG